MRFFLVLALFSLAALATGRRWDPDTNYYCGISPFPAEAPDYPPLPKGLTFHHQSTFFRHGARSPTKSNACFPKDTTQWSICSNAMRMQPSILTDRFSLEARARARSLSGGGSGSAAAATTSYAFPTLPQPESQAIPGSCALGHLSDRGFWQAYAQGRRLGRALRGYFNAQGRNVTLADVDIRSTDVHRTRATGIALGVGVIDTAIADVAAQDATAAATELVTRRHDSYSSRFNSGGDVGTGPQVMYRDRSGDALTMSTDLCKGAKYIKDAYKVQEWVDYDAEFGAPLRAIADELTGKKNSDLEFVYDCVKTRLCHGMDVPDLYTSKVDDALATYLDRYWSHAFFYNHTFASQVITGPLLAKIYTDLTSRAATAASGSQEAPTVSLRAGHDFGPMMNLVAALKLFSPTEIRWPPYTSTLSLELFSTGSSAASAAITRPATDASDDDDDAVAASVAAAIAPDSGFYVRAIHDGLARALGICPREARASAKKATGVESCPLDAFLAALQKLIPEPGQCSDVFPGPLAAQEYLAMRKELGEEARRKLDDVHRVGECPFAAAAAAAAEKGPVTQRTDEEIWESKRLGL